MLSLVFIGLTSTSPNNDPKPKLSDKVLELAEQVESKVINWRHWVHENAELSNREFKTAAYVAEHLKILGIEVEENVANTGESNGAEATPTINKGYPVTFNDPELTAMMDNTFTEVAGAENVNADMNAITGAEDFSFFQEQIPGLYFFIGGMPKGMDPSESAPHHTPDFDVHDAGMLNGIKLMSRLVVDYAEKTK